MKLLDLQIKLAQERLTELRVRRRTQGKRPDKDVPKYATASRLGTVFALRLKSQTFKVIGSALGLSPSRASQLFGLAKRVYARRKRVPIFHRLSGPDWVAWNCSEWFQRSHPETCIRKSFEFHAGFHPLSD